MADPITGRPEEAEFAATIPPPEGALRLLRRRDFRRTYAAVVVSELGDSFHYVALMWFALVSAGPLGVLAVRLADSVPALLFGRPVLATAVVALAVGVTIGSGAWMVGVPQLVRKTLDLGAGSFSAIAAGYGVGALTVGAVLSRVHVRRKARASLFLWMLYAAGYALFAVSHSLPVAIAAGAVTGGIQSGVMILLYSAAQEEVPDAVLGRVVGLISLVHRGTHATGLLLIGPLFALFATRTVFAGAAVALPLVGVAGLAAVSALRSPAAGAAARARARD